ncbi:MAG: DUF2723 domain-containing protein [bacterium]
MQNPEPVNLSRKPQSTILFRNPKSEIRNGNAVWFAAFISSALYLYTLSPGLSFGDSGELIAGAATLGIVHPPGYSLFLVAGRLFLALPIPGDIAWRMNLFTALCGVCAVSLFCLLLRRMLNRLSIRGSVADISALAGALLFAFSRTWWSQCVVTEVYTLQVALVVGVLLALESGRLSLAWFLSGLSIIAHPSSVLVFPLCLWMSVNTVRTSPRKTVWFIALLGLGLSPGLYVFLRGIGAPWQDWGQIGSLGEALDHLTRRKYAGLAWHRYLALVWMLKRYVLSVMNQWTLIGIPVLIGGYICIRRWKVSIATLSLVLFLITGPIAIILLTGLLSPSQRADFDPFCLLSYLLLAGLMTAAVAWLMQRWMVGGILIAVLLLGLVCAVNGPKVSQAGNTFPEEYADLLASNIPPGAAVVPIKDSTSYSLDYAMAVGRMPTRFPITRLGSGQGIAQIVDRLAGEGQMVLTDIVPETLRLRDRMKPNGLLMEICPDALKKPPVEAVLSAEESLREFGERAHNWVTVSPRSLEGRVLSTHYVDLALIFEAHNRSDDAKRLFNKAIEWNPNNLDAHIRLADLAVRTHQLDEARLHLSVAISTDPFVSSAYFVRGHLKLAEQDADGAIQDWERARRIDPTDSLSRRLLARAYLELGRTRKARNMLYEVLKIDPDNEEAKRMLQQAIRSGDRL